MKNIDIPKVVKTSLKYAKEDYYFRIREEKKLECIHVLKILNICLNKNKELISKEELNEIRHKMNKLQESIDQNDFFAMKLNLKKLEEKSKKFFSLQLKNAISLSSIKNILKENT